MSSKMEEVTALRVRLVVGHQKTALTFSHLTALKGKDHFRQIEDNFEIEVV